ncbi:MAG: YabP/YqfC family sporulation protein [Sporomusaceae bacterium]|nr:YabP/YqfC family sporulation protein [Sporomusaceae bacterium]
MIEYTTQIVRIRLKQGVVIVVGSNLSLGSLQVEQILVEGLIQSLRYDL